MRAFARSTGIARAALAVLLAGFALVGPGHAGEEPDVWRPLRALVGTWRGEGSGFGATSDVAHEWRFVLGGRFLELRTRSVQRTEKGAGEVHEDVGFVSRDTDRKAFVFRQFLSEGFVNTYDVTVEGGERATIRFGDREAESAGGMRARMHLTFLSDREYEMVLELAAPGKDFAACQRMRMAKAP